MIPSALVDCCGLKPSELTGLRRSFQLNFTAKCLMMPWDKRTETQTAKRRRQNREMKRERDEQQCFEREKFNSIDQYLLSGDEQVIICSYFAHHLNIFSVVSEEHLHTLEDRWAPLSLRTAALTHTVVYLILSNYNEAQHVLYLTLWDTQKDEVSMWDLDVGTMLPVFTPDSKIQTVGEFQTEVSIPMPYSLRRAEPLKWEL
ncbi:uncharacterized protein LOC127414360 isoform X4 [Myxocyprinus asiaticus]|uniref:uncharacterized protein LOC127414360 isoform X4 n=1 Tax=Myxocyprinus asiaticus TaxID=70543 RepID=UPI002223A568|nr:uncharacterized protein LOC127414360 isoform X4 [Myxocyprinus asiaticus]